MTRNYKAAAGFPLPLPDSVLRFPHLSPDTLLFQQLDSLFVVWQHRGDKPVKGGAVVFVADMSQLMDHHIVNGRPRDSASAARQNRDGCWRCSCQSVFSPP